MAKLLMGMEDSAEREDIMALLSTLLSKIGKDSNLNASQRVHVLDASKALRRAVEVVQKTTIR